MNNMQPEVRAEVLQALWTGAKSIHELMSATGRSQSAVKKAVTALVQDGTVWTISSVSPCKYEIAAPLADIWSDAT